MVAVAVVVVDGVPGGGRRRVVAVAESGGCVAVDVAVGGVAVALWEVFAVPHVAQPRPGSAASFLSFPRGAVAVVRAVAVVVASAVAVAAGGTADFLFSPILASSSSPAHLDEGPQYLNDHDWGRPKGHPLLGDGSADRPSSFPALRSTPAKQQPPCPSSEAMKDHPDSLEETERCQRMGT